jgi:hypothetical protein
MLDHHRHCLVDRKDDLYETPACAVEALLQVEALPKHLWEPACGRGAIVNVLRARGHEVIATDLIAYDTACTPPGYFGIDFLLEWCLPAQCEGIITNPPYKLATEFAEHAIALAPKVYLLCRLGFLASSRRTVLLEHGTLARVYVFRNRLPMMHRHGWTGNKSSSAIDFAWYVWDAAHCGPTQLHRISWQ